MTVSLVVIPSISIADVGSDLAIKQIKDDYPTSVAAYAKHCSIGVPVDVSVGLWHSTTTIAAPECKKISPTEATDILNDILLVLRSCNASSSDCLNAVRSRQVKLLPVITWAESQTPDAGSVLAHQQELTDAQESQADTLEMMPYIHQAAPRKGNILQQTLADVNRAVIDAGHAAGNLVPKNTKCLKAVTSPNWGWAVVFMTEAKSSNTLARLGITDRNTCLARRAQLADEAEKSYAGIGRDTVSFVGECLCTQVY
jgi:hypothetical protein